MQYGANHTGQGQDNLALSMVARMGWAAFWNQNRTGPSLGHPTGPPSPANFDLVLAASPAEVLACGSSPAP